MSGKQHKAPEEEGGCEVGLWYVSFADMITLLLAFFVMLSSFSSYDKPSLNRIRAISPKRYASALPGMRDTGSNSLINPLEGYPLQTFGEPTTGEGTTGVWPPTPPAPGTFANHERKAVRVPLEDLFRGDTSVLSPAGARNLAVLAQYLSRTPYCVHLAAGGSDTKLALQRQYQAASFLAEKGVPWKSIGLGSPKDVRLGGRADLVLTFLPGGTLQ
jgi:hypothetical protein